MPKLGQTEGELSRITEALEKGTAASPSLLDELIALSAELEAIRGDALPLRRQPRL